MSQNHVRNVITQLHHRTWKKVAMNLYDLNHLKGLRHQLPPPLRTLSSPSSLPSPAPSSVPPAPRVPAHKH